MNKRLLALIAVAFLLPACSGGPRRAGGPVQRASLMNNLNTVGRNFGNWQAQNNASAGAARQQAARMAVINRLLGR
jgi:hypothetical protein